MGKTHVALKDRDWLIIKRQGEKEDQNEVIVHPEDEMINRPRQISLEKRNKPNGFSISNMNLDNSTALLDFDKLSFPLKIRKWQAGDKFRPLGMKGFKKISDFLIDEKISRFEKENTHVMLSKDEIIWVVGHRIDDRFKVGKDTQIMYLGRLHNPRV